MLQNFFIIHPPLCKREGQEENKILYFHPDPTPSQKLKQIGLAEALNAVSKSFSGNCEALRTKKFTHAFLEPEQDLLISLSIKNGDTQYSHALLLSVLNDWYELFMRIHGNLIDLLEKIGLLKLKELLSSFFGSFLEKMKIHSYGLPELFCSYELDNSTESQFDLIYLVNRIRSRFSPIDGHLIFSKNTVYSTNIDRQSVYILMIYLSSMFSDAENGFLNLDFDSFFVPAKNKRQNIFVYYRQSHFCVFLIDQNLSLDKKFPLIEIKSFLDKNLPLKSEDQKSSSQSGMKEAFNYYICDEQNGNSKDTFYSFSGIERQCKIHPSVSSLIVAFQQIYLMPNGGEVSAETSDNTWILTKSDNKKMSVFVEKKASEKNLSDITSDVDKILSTVHPGISFETDVLRKQ